MPRRAIVAAALLVACGKGKPPPPAPVPEELRPLHPHGRIYEGDTTDLVPALVGKLGVAPVQVLTWAKARLAAEGERAVAAIRTAFYEQFSREENAPRLASYCEVLGLARLPSAIPILRDALGHPSGLVREKAFDALAAVGAPEAVADLAVVFEMDAPAVLRRACLRAIASARTEEAARVLRGLLADERSAPFHRDAIDFLSIFPEAHARPGLEPALARAERAIRLGAAKALARFGDARAIEILGEFAREGTEGERVEAAAGFALAGRTDLLASLARDPAWRIRGGVAAAVGILTGTEPAPPVARPRWLIDPLPRAERPPEAALALLRALLADPETTVKREAIRRLCALGERGCLDPLVARVETGSDAEVRDALETLVDPLVVGVEAVPAILARLDRTAGGERRMYLQALGHLREPRGVPPLEQDFRNSDAIPMEKGSLADYAGLMLANLGDAAIPTLRRALGRDEPPALRLRALRAATFMTTPGAGELLLALAADADENPSMRAIAARAAPAVAGLAAAAPLKRALYAEKDPRLRLALNCVLADYF